jgi:enoyl-[acyl-carrier protein] reductase III
MSSTRPRLLVLGASSGIGAGCARVFARHGYDIYGVHLDRRPAMPRVRQLITELEGHGAAVRFFNGNAAAPEQRAEVVQALSDELGPEGARIDVLLHSLAFGSLGPFVPPPGGKPLRERQLAMTFEVMAGSLAWWTRDLVAAGLLGNPPREVQPSPSLDAAPRHGARVFAMTSAGTQRAWPSYGPVSAAKAGLDAIVRQLAIELAPRGVTVNSILAGVTLTPALEVIPGHERMIEQAQIRNPSGRLTQPEDIGHCLLELSRPGTQWMTGNCIRVDGGEDTCA